MKPTKEQFELNKKGLCIYCKKSLIKDIKKHEKEQLELGPFFDWDRHIRGRGTCDSCFLKHCDD